MRKVWQSIDKGELAPVYLIYGEEEALIQETLRKIEMALSTTAYEKISFDLEQQPVEQLLEEADTFPFLVDKKLIIGHSAAFLQGTEQKISHALDYTMEWLKNPSPTAIVVFIVYSEKLDKRKKITKAMLKDTVVVETLPLTGKDLLVTLQQHASKNSYELTREAGILLIQKIGEHLQQLLNDLDKVMTYCGEEDVITPQHIEEVITESKEEDVFELTNAFVKGDVQKALQIYQDLLSFGNDPIMLTSLIAGQIRLTLYARGYMKKGLRDQEIAREMGVHPYRIKLASGAFRGVSETQLLEKLSLLAEVDYQLKSSSIKRDQILELFLLKQ